MRRGVITALLVALCVAGTAAMHAKPSSGSVAPYDFAISDDMFEDAPVVQVDPRKVPRLQANATAADNSTSSSNTSTSTSSTSSTNTTSSTTNTTAPPAPANPWASLPARPTNGSVLSKYRFVYHAPVTRQFSGCSYEGAGADYRRIDDVKDATACWKRCRASSRCERWTFQRYPGHHKYRFPRFQTNDTSAASNATSAATNATDNSSAASNQTSPAPAPAPAPANKSEAEIKAEQTASYGSCYLKDEKPAQLDCASDPKYRKAAKGPHPNDELVERQLHLGSYFTSGKAYSACFVAFDATWRLHSGMKKIAKHQLTTITEPVADNVNGTDAAASTREGHAVDCCAQCVQNEKCDYFIFDQGRECHLYDLKIQRDSSHGVADQASVELVPKWNHAAGYFRWA